ncbi:MAG: nicotinate phosphoribosyltransferase [Legionellales bacterium]|nr:nicotinate phosphoribosyltransferase [Legionellales bacterium]
MIIESLLDTDLYKFTMMQVVLHQFPGNQVEYRFKCRNPDIHLAPYAQEISQEIDHLCQLRFDKDELLYLSQFRFFKPDFIDFLRIFQLNREFIHIDTSQGFDIIIRGPWLHTILFEVPILAIVSEVYFRNQYPNADYTEGRKRLDTKISRIHTSVHQEKFLFSDFGTRRRFSKQWHLEVLTALKNNLRDHLTGTSNVLFAKQLHLKPLGTMAHEYIQACQASGPRLVDSQKFAFEKWQQEYRGDLGIALTDTYGVDAFLRDFDLYFCKLFDGVRHDSGDPFDWGEKIIAHYQQMGVDPRHKTLVFSDSLTFGLALELYWRFKDRAHPVFGIGTQLTNDLGYPSLNIVIKMTRCNNQSVAKVSDAPDKTMCLDESYLAYLRKVFRLE